MRKVWAAWVAALLVTVPAYGAEAGSTLTFSFKTRQGPTMVEAHPPSGEVGDTFESSLSLVNRKTRQFGLAPRAVAGAMRFSYTIRHQCAAFTPSCIATADFATVSTLPGGTLVANGSRISIAQPTITIPVVGGTGRYKEARGTISISPGSTKRSVFTLTLP
jgi:hypothetical protein